MSKVLTKVIQITMRCNRSPLWQNSVGLCEVQCRIYVANRWKCYPDYFADPLALHSCRRVHACIIQTHTSPETSQVTYVTMVPPSGERDTASPRGRYGGNAVSVTRAWSIHIYIKTPAVGRRQPMTSIPARPQYEGRRENTSSISSSEACIRSKAHSLGDAVSRYPLGEPWLHM